MMRIQPIRYGVNISSGAPQNKYFIFNYNSNQGYLGLDTIPEIETASAETNPFSRVSITFDNEGIYSFGNVILGLAWDLVGGLYPDFVVSTDGGESWFESTRPSLDSYSYATYCGGFYWVSSSGTGSRTRPLYKTADFITWTSVSQGITSNDRTNIASIGSTIVHSGITSVRTSTNAGLTWTRYTTGGASYTQRVFTDGTAFILVSRNFTTETIDAIKRSVDGITWTTVGGTPYIGSSAVPHSCSGSGVFLIFYGNYYLRSTDNGAAWAVHNLSALVISSCSHYCNGEFIVGTKAGNVLVSSDGLTWTTYVPSPKYGSGISAIVATTS